MEILTAVGAKVRLAPLAPHRLAVLRVWYELSPQPGDLPESVRQLLQVREANELNALQQAELPREWLGVALGQALAQKQTGAGGRELLKGASDSARAAFCAELQKWPREEQRRVLGLLLPRADAHRLELLARLLLCGLRVPAEALDELLTAAGAFEPEVVDFWLRDKHLVTLLASLVGDPKAELVWNRFCRSLTRQLLHGQPRLERLHDVLTAALSELGNAVPPDCEQALRDWGLLRQAFVNPAPESYKMLAAACERRGLTPAKELQDRFRENVCDKAVTDPAVDAFVSVFLAFHPPCEQYADYNRLTGAWLQLVHECVEPDRRADFQVFFIERHVPLKHRRALAQEYRQRDRLSSQAWSTVNENEASVPIDVLPVTVPARAAPGSAVAAAVEPALVVQPGPSVLDSLRSTQGLRVALILVSFLAIVEGGILLTIWTGGTGERPTTGAALPNGDGWAVHHTAVRLSLEWLRDDLKETLAQSAKLLRGQREYAELREQLRKNLEAAEEQLRYLDSLPKGPASRNLQNELERVSSTSRSLGKNAAALKQRIYRLLAESKRTP